jgi:uncharacterized DUF497 family protein
VKESVLDTKVLFNNSAFKHGVTKADIRSALRNFLFDEADVNDPDKYLAIGFDLNGNLLEVIYKVIDENTVNVFHAMKCRKEYIKLIER